MSNLFAAAVMAAAAVTSTQPGKIGVAFGNTIVSTYPDGRQAQLWLHPDGSYAAEGRRGDRSSGHWQVKGAKVCLKQSKPFPAPFTYCAAAPARTTGASWSGKAVTGEAIRIKIVKGPSGRTAAASSASRKG